jgi:hypothetical protein
MTNAPTDRMTAAIASLQDGIDEVQGALNRAMRVGPTDAEYEAAMAQKLAASVDDRQLMPIREQQLHAHHEYAAYAFVVIASGLIGFFIRGWI